VQFGKKSFRKFSTQWGTEGGTIGKGSPWEAEEEEVNGERF